MIMIKPSLKKLEREPKFLPFEIMELLFPIIHPWLNISRSGPIEPTGLRHNLSS
jgi:hypothetical protein